MRTPETIYTFSLAAAALAVAANTSVAQCPADDALEDNDDCASAVVLSTGSTTGLVVQNAPADDDDYFVIQGVPSGMQVTVDALFIDSVGDIDIDLYDDAACSNQIDFGSSSSDNEQVQAANTSGSPMDFYLRVELFDFSTDCNDYDLNVTVAPDPCIPDDSFEENDDCASAVVLPSGSTTGLIVKNNPDDDDFYVIQGVPNGMHLTVDALFVDSSGDVDIELYDDPACANSIDTSASTSDNESVKGLNSSGAALDYYLEVRLFAGDCNAYDLNVAVGPDPCVGDDSFEENDDCASAAVLPVGSTTGLVVKEGPDDDDFYVIQGVPANEILTVDVLFSDANGDIDVTLYDDAACSNSVDSGLSVSDDEQVEVSNTTGAAADYYLEVRLLGDSCNDYDLMVSTAPDPCLQPGVDDSFEDNDDCANATAVSNGFSQTDLFVSKSDDDFYTFTMGDGGTATLSIFFSDDTSDLDLELYDEANVLGGTCGDGSSELENSTSVSDDEEIVWTNTTGSTQTYYLRVYNFAFSSGDCNDYDITIDIQGGLVAMPFCFGDGTADAGGGPVGCPCGNESSLGAGEGCNSSLGFGAMLTATGSNSFAADDLSFTLTQGRANQPSLLVQGATEIAAPFKDGVLCTGTPTERVEVVLLDATGSGSTSGSIVTNGNIPGPGTTRYYQQWFRDPGGVSPCGTGSNFSQGLIVTFD